MISVSCPSCNEKGKVPNTYAGRSIPCYKCRIWFRAPARWRSILRTGCARMLVALSGGVLISVLVIFLDK